MKFNELKAKANIPPTVRELDFKRLKSRGQIVELTRAADISPKDYDKIIVLPGAIWAAVDTRNKDIYSYSPVTNTYSKYKRGKAFITFEYNEAERVLVNIGTRNLKQIKNKNINIPKEDTKMSNENKSSEDLLREVMGGVDFGADLEIPGVGDANAPADMQTFNSEEIDPEKAKAMAEAAAAAEKLAGIKRDIVANVGEDLIDSARELGMFNREEGGLYGLIVNTAPAIKVAKKVVPLLDGKQYVAIDGTPNDILTAAAAGQELPKEYRKTETKIVVKQAAPSTIKAAVLGIPAGGFYTPKQVVSGNFQLDRNNKAIKKIMVTKDEAMNFIKILFAEKIHDRTVEDGKLRTIIAQSNIDKKKTAETGQTIIRTSLKTEDKSKIFTETNFFPLKVYETLDVTQPLTAEQAKQASISAFYNLVKTTKKDTVPALDKLGLKYKNRIEKIDLNPGVEINSKYFVEGKQADFFGEEPKHWLTGQPLSGVRLPLRDINIEGKEKPTYPWIQYSAISSQALKGDEAYLAKTAFGLPEYAHIRECMGSVLTPAELKRVTTKPREGGKKGNGIPKPDTSLDFGQMFAFIRKNATGELDSKKYAALSTPISSASLEDRVSNAKALR